MTKYSNFTIVAAILAQPYLVPLENKTAYASSSPIPTIMGQPATMEQLRFNRQLKSELDHMFCKENDNGPAIPNNTKPEWLKFQFEKDPCAPR